MCVCSKDHTIEARAYAGLGHAARCMGDHVAAQNWHEKQLDMALKTRDKVAEGRACSNLGIVYQLQVKKHENLIFLDFLSARKGRGRRGGGALGGKKS